MNIKKISALSILLVAVLGLSVFSGIPIHVQASASQPATVTSVTATLSGDQSTVSVTGKGAYACSSPCSSKADAQDANVYYNIFNASNVQVSSGPSQCYTENAVAGCNFDPTTGWDYSDPAHDVSSLAPGTYTAQLCTFTLFPPPPGFDPTTCETSAPFTITGAASTVTVTPPTATVPVLTTEQFTATVTGTGVTTGAWDCNDTSVSPPAWSCVCSVDVRTSCVSGQPGCFAGSPCTTGGSVGPAVIWSVNSVIGGNATVGTISINGLYTAPATVPSPATVTVKAQILLGASATATVTVTSASPPPAPTVTISASPSSITLGSPTTLTWSSTNATNCTASGAWSGAEALSGSGSQTPAAVGTSVYTLTCTGAGGSAVQSASVSVSAGLPPPTGTLNVSSTNSVNGDAVPSGAWSLDGPSGDVCAATGVPCSGSSEKYPNQSANGDSYILTPSSISGFALDSVQPVPSQTLTSGNPVADFDVVWNPEASMSLSNGGVTLNSANGYATVVSVSNSGSDGSSLGWSESAAYSANSGANKWLSLSATSGSLAIPSNPTQNINLSVVNMAALATGATYTATVTFTGNSSPAIAGYAIPNKVMTVTLIVPAGGSGTPPVTVISPNPLSVCQAGTLTCSGGSGSGYTWTSSNPAVTNFVPPSGVGSTVSVSFTAQGTYQETCTDSSGASSSVAVTALAPSCSLTAAPTVVTPPQQSTLSWICSNAVSATLNGSSVATVGSEVVSPATDTVYTLVAQGAGVCGGASAGADTSVATSTVTINGSHIHEGTP